MESLWEKVGNECLNKALSLLQKETAPTVETAEAVQILTKTAIDIDDLNLRWAEKSRSYAAVFRGHPSSRQEGES